ncbi:hypothetical protein AUC70_04615 [Methyloceanibacter stevinii]|uniref:Uncharacterized protein n=1 Tax=Methyloceanibacter stevinii TaxID=1774970 RepID=A0A1E3VNC7_9HYPH|nr:hypothetical protein AUC70_04615 [Methyloceanibacter stevinii]
MRRVFPRLGALARTDVAPGADYFARRSLCVVDQVLLVVHPAIGAVLVTEAVFDGQIPRLEESLQIGVEALEVVGMNALAPEAGIAEIVSRRVAEQTFDIVADEGGSEVVARLEGVKHRGRGGEQARSSRRGIPARAVS